MSSNQCNFFSGGKDLEALKQEGDPLAKLESYIDFEMFRPLLEESANRVAPKGPGGRPRWDLVLMFKVLVLQRIYNLSDERAEYHIRDSLSFHRFLGLGIGDTVPDSRTIWRFREDLTHDGTVKRLFELFNQGLLQRGIITREGTMVDASFVTVPEQRNTREQNELLRKGERPKEWSEKPRMLAQKDTDARWTIKGNEAYFGYKNHIKVDEASKLIVSYRVTPASTNDGKILPLLVDERDKRVHADSAYQTPMNRAYLKRLGIAAHIQVKGTRHVVLTERQKEENRQRSTIRSRVEHVFALIKNSLGGLHLEYIRLDRITSAVGLINLVHNMVRFGQLRQS
jgi:IS5 family transposase